MYELKRDESRYLEIKVGNDILRADLSHGMRQYRNYLKFKSQLEQLSFKMNNGLELNEETIGYFLALTKAFLDCIFRSEDTAKILAFFDDDAEECLERIMPFVLGEYQTALKEAMQERSKRKIDEYIRTGHSKQ